SWSSMSSLLVIPTCVLLKIKLINGNIADAPYTMKIFDRRLIRARLTFPFSTLVVGNSHAGLAAYKVPENKRICIYNGFDIARVTHLQDKQSIRKLFKIKTARVVGMVGSFYGNKDYETFLEAAMLTFEKRDDVTFVAVGDGPERSRLQQQIPPEYASRFIFTGLQKDVESIINVFDIGILATNTLVHGEGISNAILEYMALGKPTIATIGGGTCEAVEEGKTGFLVPSSTPVDIAEKLTYLLDNESLMKKMGLAGKQRLESVFGIQKMMRTYYELYKGMTV
ncbi:MAG: glycosyltransferase, partial [Maribacter sp.]|nr:glycosyltransferase [Maribacter sp.]